jgi:hypothetical protein
MDLEAGNLFQGSTIPTINGNPAAIQTEYLFNTHLMHYDYTNLFHQSFRKSSNTKIVHHLLDN